MSELRFGRLLAVWAPLAATFLLITGATPVVNACINRLPGRVHETDLAAFALFLSVIVVLHSPLFVVREITMKMSVHREGARRAMRFTLMAAAVIALVELLIGVTPLGRFLLGGFSDKDAIVDGAQSAFIWVWPVPFVIGARGVYQANQIQHDDTLFVGLGTLVRLICVAIFGLMIAPGFDVSGPVLGAICIVAGISIETAFAVWRARVIPKPPETSTAEVPRITAFALPLMFANMLGVLASLFYLRIAARVPEDLQEASLAAFQEVRPLAWLFTAGGFAMQSLTTAKVKSRADEMPMVRFGVFVGATLSLLMGLCAFVEPVRSWILVDLMGERPGGRVLEFAVPTLMLAVGLPLFQSVRFALRGVLIARHHTRAITVINLVSLAMIGTAISFELLPTANGSFNAYVIWFSTMAVELVVMFRLIRAPHPVLADVTPPDRPPDW